MLWSKTHYRTHIRRSLCQLWGVLLIREVTWVNKLFYVTSQAPCSARQGLTFWQNSDVIQCNINMLWSKMYCIYKRVVHSSLCQLGEWSEKQPGWKLWFVTSQAPCSACQALKFWKSCDVIRRSINLFTLFYKLCVRSAFGKSAL